MPSPPSYQKVNPADQPVLYIAVSSPLLPLSQVDEYAETFLAQRISSVQGVAQVQVYGSQKYAVRIQLDPRKLANMRVGVEEVTQAIRSSNVNMPTGTLYGPNQAFTIQSSGQLATAKEYRSIVVTYRNGRPVRLEDVANVFDSVENTRSGSWYKDSRAMVLAVQRQPGTNTV
jgi:HAE1 family hydrophobic/amphiphilic exporter-1